MTDYVPKKTGIHVVDGVIFESWRIGINRYESISPDGRLRVTRNQHVGNGGTYTASLDGQQIGDRYRSLRGAMAAAIKATRLKGAP